MQTDLSKFDNSWYKVGASVLKRILWYYTNLLIFNSRWLPLIGLKRSILRAFGGKVGKSVVIKPGVNIKYPWKLEVGDYSWIGEGVWIDNLAEVRIGKNVCLSQGSMLLCGNHNYKKKTFDLMVKSITLEDGVWIGAMSTVTPGLRCHSHSILSVGSVATKDLESYTIYSGVPAVEVRKREIGQD